MRTAADGTRAWGLCALGAGRTTLIAWNPNDVSLTWCIDLLGEARFAVSPDGALLLLCDDRGTRTLLDARNGVALHETLDAQRLPNALALARSEARRALVLRGRQATLLNLDTDTVVATFEGTAPVALSPDGRRVALCSPRAVIVHDLHRGVSARHPIPWGVRVSAIDCSEALAVGFDDGSARITVARRHCVVARTGHPVTALRARRDGTLAIGHSNGLVRAFSADRGWRESFGRGSVDDLAADLSSALLREACAAPMLDLVACEHRDPREGHLDTLIELAITPDGQRVVTTSRDRTLRVWCVDSCETLLTLEGDEGAFVTLALSPDGREAYTTDAHGGLHAWCLSSGAERSLSSPVARALRAKRLIPSPCGRRLAALTHAEALLLDVATGALVGRIALGPWGTVAVFDARGERLLVPRARLPEGLSVACLDATTGAALEDVLLPLASPDARRARPCSLVVACGEVLVVGETDRAAVTCWLPGASPETTHHRAGADLLRGRHIALGGSLLAAASGPRIDVCDLSDGRRGTFQLPQRHDVVTCLSVDRSGRFVIVGTAQGLALRFDQ